MYVQYVLNCNRFKYEEKNCILIMPFGFRNQTSPRISSGRNNSKPYFVYDTYCNKT